MDWGLMCNCLCGAVSAILGGAATYIFTRYRECEKEKKKLSESKLKLKNNIKIIKENEKLLHTDIKNIKQSRGIHILALTLLESIDIPENLSACFRKKNEYSKIINEMAEMVTSIKIFNDYMTQYNNFKSLAIKQQDKYLTDIIVSLGQILIEGLERLEGEIYDVMKSIPDD